ncbi:hypothetical protein [Leptothoe spongobia]|uniref:Uncharacterized protein n=1 Tax=Leptothoe spongobia TAU-MAC 1115 TaxID=1967444 RepID=A0A947DHR1_9CYAN|nr:hypothetical protein [Leptothoe spongobia]MBT9317195.1 hypothetical protein [Leptothoe spongobia TAU-MAC 1115]
MKWRHIISRITKGIVFASLGVIAVNTSPLANAQEDANAQENNLPPTARYAAGEDLDLALIIAEWKERFPDIPVFACACNADACAHTERWPFRNYSRYQLTVALGPFNGTYTESLGFNCFDIQTGQGLDQAPEIPTDPPEPEPPVEPEPPTEPTGTPMASVSADKASLILTWPDNQTNTIDITGWNINVLDALDCETVTQVPQKTLNARRIIGTPMVDPLTDNVAVPVLLEECLETQQTAVFVVDPQGVGGHALYRTQVPGERPLPNEFSSYGLSSISGLQYWDSTLLVRHGSASGAEALLVFRPDITPAGKFASCGFLNTLEGANRLCPAELAEPSE